MGLTRKERLRRQLARPVDPVNNVSVRREAVNKCLCVRFDPDMGFRLSLIRQRLNIQQYEMARRLGVSQQAMSKIEGGKTQLPHIAYMQLKSVIDVPGKNFLNFLFLGPPRSIWYEFVRISGNRAMGMRDQSSTIELLKDYEMI